MLVSNGLRFSASTCERIRCACQNKKVKFTVQRTDAVEENNNVRFQLTASLERGVGQANKFYFYYFFYYYLIYSFCKYRRILSHIL